MFTKLRNWLKSDSGLRQATREAAREATREGLTEGFNQGVADFLERITGTSADEPRTIEAHANGNGHPAPSSITAAELRGKRKPELLDLAESQGIEADESWTVAELKNELQQIAD